MLHVVKVAIDIMAPRLGQVFEHVVSLGAFFEMLTYHCKMYLWGWWLWGQGQRAEMDVFPGSLPICPSMICCHFAEVSPPSMCIQNAELIWISSVKVHEVCSATLTSLKV